MTLERISYPGQPVVQVRLETCPCGHEFDDGESRSQHFLDDHTPADFGLSPRLAADGGTCLDCGRNCRGARCSTCSVEHGAPEYESGPCPDCGQETKPAGARCGDCLGGDGA
ncbi:hypothetical protein [Halobacterium litoreum]|uniref:C2H2-type domain-containing protein n=1 Tax=Halobacterium litoreum TaxID=2039234 RepID=A0ABD5NA48_9EURY|nr:hypothetical protein [Halobacterium litoreum]UHH11997.1 hypothetical protein LT972_07480 [Halobacterium litoreum]